jgi:hypothetical protein
MLSCEVAGGEVVPVTVSVAVRVRDGTPYPEVVRFAVVLL